MPSKLFKLELDLEEAALLTITRMTWFGAAQQHKVYCVQANRQERTVYSKGRLCMRAVLVETGEGVVGGGGQGVAGV